MFVMSVLFNSFFTIIVNIIAIVTEPISIAINTYIPNISNFIVSVSDFFTEYMVYISWPLSWLPSNFVATLIGLLTCGSGWLIFTISTSAITKVFSIIGKIKIT